MSAVRRLAVALTAMLFAQGCAVASNAATADAPVVEAAHPGFAAFVVSDAGALSAWYMEVFGVAVRNDIDLGARGRILILDNETGLTFELIEFAGAVDPVAAIDGVEQRSLIRGPFKAGVFVPDADAAHAAATAAGLDVDAQVFADKALSRGAFVLRDPEGNRIQVFGPRSD